MKKEVVRADSLRRQGADSPKNPHLYFFFTISDTTRDAAMACESASMVRAAAVIGL
jgi:hypothetical protein